MCGAVPCVLLVLTAFVWVVCCGPVGLDCPDVSLSTAWQFCVETAVCIPTLQVWYVCGAVLYFVCCSCFVRAWVFCYGFWKARVLLVFALGA